jgi:hypothetical protein
MRLRKGLSLTHNNFSQLGKGGCRLAGLIQWWEKTLDDYLGKFNAVGLLRGYLKIEGLSTSHGFEHSVGTNCS